MKLNKMKRKYADRRGWRRIIRSHVDSRKIMWPSFHGDAVLLTFDEVKAPLSVIYGGTRTKTVDQEFTWLQIFPEPSVHYVLTAMFNARSELVQCYFDVTYQEGRSSDGILWFDDLYLDVILFPNHDYYLVDEAELGDARASEVITQEMYETAQQTARELVRFIHTNPEHFLTLARKIHRLFFS